MSPQERLIIEKKFYKNFIDILLESFKGLKLSAQEIIPRYRFVNPEILDPYFEEAKPIIIFSQHYNNWEWAPICLGLQMKHELVGIVKMLSNPYINKYIMNGRSGNNVSVVPSNKTYNYFKEQNYLGGKPKGVVFIADQKPYGKQKALELEFLEASALFHHGASMYAVEYDFPVFSFDVHRVNRGEYKVEAVCLVDSSLNQSAEDLTILYKEHLEYLIRRDPSAWLWSHKRFKDRLKY